MFCPQQKPAWDEENISERETRNSQLFKPTISLKIYTQCVGNNTGVFVVDRVLEEIIFNWPQKDHKSLAVTREFLVDVLYTKPTPPLQLPSTSVGFRDDWGTRNNSTCSNDVTLSPEFEFIPTNKRIGNHSDKSRFLIKNYTWESKATVTIFVWLKFYTPTASSWSNQTTHVTSKNDFYKTSISRSYSLFVLQSAI